MFPSFLLFSLSFFFLCQLALARVNIKVPRDLADDEADRLNTVYSFDQLIDHSDPSLGTFKQRYWINTEWYDASANGPIVLINNGEASAEGSAASLLTNQSVIGRMAQDHSGAPILLEHRYFGLSQPFDDLSTESLQYLTLQNSIDDNVYFAENVQLPMDGGDALTPTDVPWILTGGSYPGALVSWTMTNRTGVFYAGYSSSGVVQAIVDFNQYHVPIIEGMPQNCSSDVMAVIAYIDETFKGNDQRAIDSIKAMFGASQLDNLDDMMILLDFSGWWQSLDIISTDEAINQFYGFCDFMEVTNDGQFAPAAGWGLDYALPTWASYISQTTCAVAADGSNPCNFDTHQSVDIASVDITIGSFNSDNRAWAWLFCNEFGWLQGGPSSGGIVSSLIDAEYMFRTSCIAEFPDVFAEFVTPSADQTNAIYGSWNGEAERIVFANGKRDPWREATVSAQASAFKEDDLHAVALSDGFHCSDFWMDNGEADQTVGDAQETILTSIDTWLKDWSPDWNAGLRTDESTNDNAAEGLGQSMMYAVLPLVFVVVFF